MGNGINKASVLVGDFLYSRSFEMMVSVESMRVMDILSHATNRIAEGEVLQLSAAQNLATDAAERLLALPQTQTLWEEANRTAHEQLVAVLREESTETALFFLPALRKHVAKATDLRPISLLIKDERERRAGAYARAGVPAAPTTVV